MPPRQDRRAERSRHAFVPFPFHLALALAAALPPLATAADLRFSCVLCCNMRSDGGRISDSN